MSRTMSRFAFLLLTAVAFSAVKCQEQPPQPPQPQPTRFSVIREWDYINFTWPSEAALKTAMGNGNYVPENIIMSGVQWSDDRFFICLPRMKSGVPATLATIPATVGPVVNTAPALTPYPSWEMNTLGDCNALQNVQNVAVDKNGNIWVVDGGRTGTLTKDPDVKCPPKLVIIDTKTNRTTTTYTFPENIAMHNGSFLYDIVVDQVEGDTFAYITDNSGSDPGIIVFSLGMNKSWKIRDDGSMRAFLEAHDFRVNEVDISVPINLAGIALGPNYENSKYRRVYYTPISSFNLYSISTEILRNESYGSVQVHQWVQLEGRRMSQTDGMTMDNMGLLYYGLLADSSIAVWNSSEDFNTTQRIIARDTEYIQWPNAFTFDMSGNIIVLTNKLHKFIYGTLNLYEPNFRFLHANTGTKSYIYGTPLPASLNPETMVRTPFVPPGMVSDSASTRRYDLNQNSKDSSLHYDVNKGQSEQLHNKNEQASSSNVIYAIYSTVALAILATNLF